ncbi:MAG: hypothetical protein R3Y68_09920 [Rikenellaceae bacterium]
MKKIKDSANKLCYIEPQKGRGNFDSFIKFFETNFEYDNEGWAQTPRREDNGKGWIKGGNHKEWMERRQAEFDNYFKAVYRNVNTKTEGEELKKLILNRKLAMQRSPIDETTKEQFIKDVETLVEILDHKLQMLDDDTPQSKQEKETEIPSFEEILLRGDNEKKKQIVESIRSSNTTGVGAYVAGVYSVLLEKNWIEKKKKTDGGRKRFYKVWCKEFGIANLRSIESSANEYLKENNSDRGFTLDYKDKIIRDLGI